MPEQIIRFDGHIPDYMKDSNISFGEILEVQYSGRWYKAVCVEDNRFNWRFFTEQPLQPDRPFNSFNTVVETQGHLVYVSKMSAIYSLRKIR